MKIGSLFSGAAGLDRAVEAVFGGEVVWHSEIDKAASKVLAHRWPDVPNLGSITEIDWATVEPVDVLCGGFPCQDVSAAGKRAGIKDGTRSGLWAVFAEAIDALRPQYVVIENVRGLLSSAAHRTVEEDERDSLEPGAAVVGDGSSGPVLRAAGAVLGDLADIGYDAVWATVAASAVGAPHRRERVFIVGTASHTGHDAGCPEHGIGDASDSSSNGWDEGRPESARIVGGFDAAVSGDELGVALLPTPQAHDSKGPKTPEQVATMRAKIVRRDTLEITRLRGGKQFMDGGFVQVPHACTLNANLCRDVLLCTPSASDGAGGKTSRSGGRIDEPLLGGQAREMATAWGKYAPAIARWEQIVGPAPAPTEPNKNGNPRLSAAFSEWMLGWPARWVTDPAIGINRNDQLRIVGNGVCTQQAIAALRYLLAVC